ncbi:MAG TPA: hypothetical protein VFC99_04465 [Acidimicrobiia bacterium]|nr:hypothetical protein [Acidimicrobiia bacterium]
MRDAAELEWAGIPSVAVIHEALAPTAEAMAKVSGLPGYRFATVGYPHPPLCTWSDDEIRELARELVPTVVELLSAPEGA